jgi:hypothetical protein
MIPMTLTSGNNGRRFFYSPHASAGQGDGLLVFAFDRGTYGKSANFSAQTIAGIALLLQSKLSKSAKRYGNRKMRFGQVGQYQTGN